LNFRVYLSSFSGLTPVPSYQVRDLSNSADLIAKTTITGASDTWISIKVQFTTAVGGISTRIYFWSGGDIGSKVYFDVVSVKLSTDVSHVETLAVYEQGTANYLIASQSDALYDVSTAGSPSLLSGKDDLLAAAYKWTASGSGTNEYYLELAAGGNPLVGKPGSMYLDSAAMSEGTLGSLADHEWGYGDNDTLSYSTIYVRDNSGDPDGSGVTLEMQAVITVDRWQWVNFDGKIGMVNGTDIPLQWDGNGNFKTLTLSGSGLTNTSVIGCHAFKSRTWWWMKNSQDVWYSALDTLGGALTKFPLSRVGQFGGNLTAMTTWSHDGGSGPDDYAVFIMSSGEAIIYQGSSPAVGGDWALVGVYNIGEPLSIRSVAKYGGDVIAITKLDYVNLARVLPGIEADTAKSKVVKELRDAIGTGGSLWGWEANVYPKRQLAIFNVPVVENETYVQHVMNTVTGAWCTWSGVNANTWQVYKGRMFFGGADGYVYEFDTGNDDDGTAIQSEMQTAWLPLGGFGNKMYTAVREFIRVNKDINTVNQFAVDYQDFEDQEYPVAVTSGTAEWGDPWGTPWGAADQVYKEWQTIGIYGESISLRKRLNTKQRVRYLGASWLFRPGERL
jgi:hypothetical protein